ncbi:MAG: peptidoglycan-binding protein [Ruminococcus sp.]|jgi:peptidoglycan hydrolase-like protein with peptidoglycan-binding domain|nr:peptidoglycan-binding protein [Ruminococcus sp.]
MVGEPFIPENLTVHLGSPNDTSARNIVVPFPQYVKNVASSELYPSWPENALRANIYAIISFALNRYYTEWYRSKGYNFDITSDTQYDQKYIENRSIYEPISVLVDEMFNDYLVRDGSQIPMASRFCDGRQVQCEGLSQWGSVDLANQGYIPYDILRYYYGDDINIIRNADVRTGEESYPGKVLELGSNGPEVEQMQMHLNSIANNYPAIPKITPVSTIYDLNTANAVTKFQEIFNLPQTGRIDQATWYKIIYIYTSVKKLAELDSEGLSLDEITVERPPELKKGDEGVWVKRLDYYLKVISAYYREMETLSQNDEFFGEETENVLKSFQSIYGLPVTGIADETTWNELYRAYKGIADNVPLEYTGQNAPLYPGTYLTQGITSDYVALIQQYLSYLADTYPDIPKIPVTGYYGPQTEAAVTAFQKRAGLPVTGDIGVATWNEITRLYSDLYYGYTRQPGQFPGYTIG